MANPSVKLNSIAFSSATAIVFTLWTQINNLAVINDILQIILGAIISLGLYRLIATGIIYLTMKKSSFKSFFLGPHYLEGTWVGFYIGPSGKVRYLIEQFEQDVDKLVVRGKSFDESFKYHSTWNSTSINIDVINGRISYMYECLPINDQTNNNGIAVFNFERDNQYSAPKELRGFSTDLHIGKRVKAMEVKISKKNISETDALEKAKEIYKNNKDNF